MSTTNLSSQKPIYSLSVSLINKVLWHKSKQTQESLQQFKDAVAKVYTQTEYMTKGLSFEDEVFAGKHGEMSEIVKDTLKQKWYDKTIEYLEFDIRLSGKMDAVSLDESIIFDIKKMNYWYAPKFEDKNNSQHTIYFYLNKKAQKFYYLVAYEQNGILKTAAVEKVRPSDEILEEQVKTLISNFILLLRECGNETIESYQKNYTYTQKYN